MAAGDLYTGITVQGLYNEQSGDALYGVIGTTAPASALFLAGKDSVSGNLTPLTFTGGALNVNATITPPSDNTATGTITNTQNVSVSTSGTSALMVQVEGTWTGTLDFEVTLDGTTWVAASVYPVFPDASPAVSTATANGTWTLAVGGVRNFRVRGNTVATGTATVFLTAGQGQYGVVATSPVAANFLATVNQGTSPWVTSVSNTVTVTGTVTANAGTGTFRTAPDGTIWALTGTSANVDVTNTVTVTGTVAVTQSTSPWVVAGNLTHNNAAPAANNVGALVAVASSAAPTYTAGDQVLLSTDLAGNLRTSATVSGTVSVQGTLTNNNAAPAANNLGVLGFVAETAYNTVTYTTGNQVLAVTDLHGAINNDMQAVAGVQLGATAVTAFGTAPAAANVQGTNSSIYAGTTGLTAQAGGQLNTAVYAGTTAITATGSSLNVDVTNTVTVTGTVAVTQSTTPWVVAGNKTNNNAAPSTDNVGVLGFLANAASPTNTEGDLVLGSVDLSGRQRVRGTLTTNNAAPTGDNIGVLPAVVASGTFPATTLPALTAGDQALVSITQGGSLRVIPADEANAASINYFSADMGDTQKSIANPAVLPLISIRTNSAAILVQLRGFNLMGGGQLVRYQLIKNATLTGATFAATSPSANTQVDTAATSFSGGTVVDSGYFGSTQWQKNVILAMAAGTPGDRYSLIASSISGTVKVSGSIQWSEQSAAI